MSVINDSVQFDNICRTCLSEKQNMKSVFDTDSSLGETLQLFEMLMACTSVQVQEDDGLPAQMCLSCIDCIARSLQFKKRCEDSDTTLREVLRKSTITADDQPLIELKPFINCALSEALGPNEDQLDIKMEFETGGTKIDDSSSGTESTDWELHDIKMTNNDDDLQSETIQSAYNDIKNDLIHVKIDVENEGLKGNALINDNEKSIESSMFEHSCKDRTASVTVENDLKIHPDDTPRKSTKRKCKVCSEEFSRSSQLERHNVMVHNHTSRRHVCSECGNRFGCHSDLTKHLRTHTGEELFVCKVCDKRFTQACTLTKHMRAHNNEQQFTCSTCEQVFSRQTTFRLHMKGHTDSTPPICRICDKRFRSAKTLAVHMKTHTGEINYLCSDCGKRFTASSAFTAHKRLHTGERPYICSVCNKGFRHSSYLAQHVRTHSGEKPHACTVCNKQFRVLSHLKDHMRMHTGERPFQCHLCPKAFTRGWNLRVHIKTHTGHTGERNHTCVHCKKGYDTPERLRIHQRVHTGEKPYACKMCDKSFSRSSNLYRHLFKKCS